MEITLPIASEFSIKIAANSVLGEGYPTAYLQKGLQLMYKDQDLAEEGVGFGVPVVKRGIQTIFPGNIELTARSIGSLQQVTARFSINLEEKIARPGYASVKTNLLYTVKNSLAALIRHFPLLRGPLTNGSNALRRIFGWETSYEKAGTCLYVEMIYTVDNQAGTIDVEVNLEDLLKNGITEIVVMNEQGANHFDEYRDSHGTVLIGKGIGCWDEVTAAWAAFISKNQQVAFTLRQVDGAKLFRGRELVGSRLAWSGFGYSFPPAVEKISYQVKIERLQ